ncbi:chromosome segregation protein SMC [Roseiterribacter gracilis]|uniref:Chromosome partition protein Smc n=1 Tax=Roseiterribacter gracilis TaxID=2812848 RepID=A0A8S8XEA2_9PROT|nr:chromosome partition protein Smc [Rhodospirillales bacterium TMPK1]
MQFTRLRLTGFKSFVDSTDLPIEPGMTGVIGPNGCGKSNLVEALRWVMGETSAKRMRGGEMDDVIFGGTATRPRREIAEVALLIDNKERAVSNVANLQDELEVVRRIERGSGSDFKVNGKSVRAKDVQILFADASTGANSPSLVSQGKVAAIISAKPQDRRFVLEDAAGIAGIRARRHEAELKLKGAENNLDELDRVLGTMDDQIAQLKKQARQASRYRNLSDAIRQAEAVVLFLRWKSATAKSAEARSFFDEAENVVRERMAAVARATAEATDLAASVPPLRETDMDAAAAVQRLQIARETLENEARQLAAAVHEAERQAVLVEGDRQHETAQREEAQQAEARLTDEDSRLAAEQSGEEAEKAAAEAAFVESRRVADAAEQDASAATSAIAAATAERQALERQSREADNRAQSVTARLENQKRELSALGDDSEAEQAIASAQDEAEQTEARVGELRDAQGQAEEARTRTDAGLQESRSLENEADAALRALDVEINTLTQMLRAGASEAHGSVLEQLTVAPGFETALAAALGDALEASLDDAAPVYWRNVEANGAPSFPHGVEPLATHINAPAALARALAHVGVVADSETGARLAANLAPGQVLVARDGAAWRWDGLTHRAGAPTAAAIRLQQKNRLTALESDRPALADAREAARAARVAAEQAHSDAVQAERTARQAVSDASQAYDRARAQHSRLVQAHAQTMSRRAALTEAVAGLEADLAEVAALREDLAERVAQLPDASQMQQRLEAARNAVQESRRALNEAQQTMQRLEREAGARRSRRAQIESEYTTWTQRVTRATQRLSELNERAAQIAATRAELEDKPATLDARRQALLSELSQAEAARRTTADALAIAEAQVASADRQLRQAESSLSDAREDRARAEAGAAAALEEIERVKERVTEKLRIDVEGLQGLAEIADDDPLPETHKADSKLERLLNERENMGPVNLLAEQEMQELEGKMEAMTSEKEDVIAAIARLREAVETLNKEARERLEESFNKINEHFKVLFTRLFGGGAAELKLAWPEKKDEVTAEEGSALADAQEAEAAAKSKKKDPLEAGLEIYAQPPGKKLQNLSLLSGGEQALTAVALLFAMFLTNPSPICVLDEVDAPLDDANVDRFCSMVEEIARDSGTRFLVITHHRLTMARMDRLFGVTMAERGISQLVSVDLTQTDEILEAAE